MDVEIIRSRFIQENLRRALQEPDKERAARALRAFRIYFQWFENKVPDFEKVTIIGQLERLERITTERAPKKALDDLTHADGIGHHLQETPLRKHL